MVMGDDDGVYDWDIFDLTRWLSVPFRAQPGKWGAAVGKDRIEEHTETAGKLDIIACVAQPGCPQFI